MFHDSLKDKICNFLVPKYTDSQVLLVTIFFIITFGIEPGNGIRIIYNLPVTIVGFLYLGYVGMVMFKKGVSVKHYHAIQFIGILMIVPMTFLYVIEAMSLLDFSRFSIHNAIFIFYALPTIIRFLLYLTVLFVPDKSRFSFSNLSHFISKAEKQNVGGLLTIIVVILSLLVFTRYFYMYDLYYAQGIAFFVGSFCFDVIHFIRKTIKT